MTTHTADLVIEVKNVTRTFGATTALDSVSFQVERNTICGLLGSNGAGKTTIMAIITGQDRANSGEVRVDGHDPFESAHVADSTSFVRDNQRYPDDYKLHHVLRAAAVFHPNWSDQLADKLVATFRLPAKTQVKKFSRGQLSALAIVLGLASRAPITVFDEPYLGLDIAARDRFYEILLQEHLNHPRTFLISTHLIEEMENIFSHVVVLDQGRAVVNSEVEDLDGLVYEVAGKAVLVEEFVRSRTVLKTRTVGTLASAIVSGPLAEHDRASAQAVGLTLSSVALHNFVSAIGNSYNLTEDAS